MSSDHGLDDDKWLRLSFPFPLPHVQRKREQDLDLHGQRDSVPGRRTMRMIHFPLTLPTTDFPNQGQGQLSEFFVQRPIWAMEPSNSQLTVWSPVCGCGGTSMPPLTETSSGP